MDKGGGLQRRSGSQVSHLEMCMLWTSLPRKSSSWGDAARDHTRHLRGLAVCRAPRRAPRTLDLTHASRHPEAVTALPWKEPRGSERKRRVFISTAENWLCGTTRMTAPFRQARGQEQVPREPGGGGWGLTGSRGAEYEARRAPRLLRGGRRPRLRSDAPSPSGPRPVPPG